MGTTAKRDPSDALAPAGEEVSGPSTEPERREAPCMWERTFPVDILETLEEYVIRGPLLGTRPENVRITTTGDTLTIRDGQNAARPRVDGIILRRGRFETFIPDGSRTITLPGHIDSQTVNTD